MTRKELKELIKKFLQEYMGTGSSGGNATDGNDIPSPRPFADDEDEIENYINKNVYGGEGGQWVGDKATLPSYNRDPRGGMFEQIDPATMQRFNDKKIRLQKSLANIDIEISRETLNAASDAAIKSLTATIEALDKAEADLAKAVSEKRTKNIEFRKTKKELDNLNKLEIGVDITYEDKTKEEKEIKETLDKIKEEREAIETRLQAAKKSKQGVMDQRNQITKSLGLQKTQLQKQINQQKKAMGQIGKQQQQQVQEQAYSHATLTSQGQSIHRAPGVWENKAQELSDSYSLEELEARLKQIYREMEQEAEPEGGPIANQYADEIYQYEEAIRIAKGIGGRGKSSQDKSYTEVVLSKLAGPNDAYEYDNEKHQLIIYPDLGSLQYKSRSSQEIVFTHIEGEPAFVRAFGNRPIYDELKKVLPEIPSPGTSMYSGFINILADEPIPMDNETAIEMIKAMVRGKDAEAGAQSAFYTRQPGTGGTGIDEVYNDYIKLRKYSNLMGYMDIYKKEILTESTMKKVFKWFDKGKTNEEILRYYASKGISVPETFISKARKQYENLKKAKLEIEFSEQEAKDFKKVSIAPQTNEEEKQLTSRLFKEFIEKELNNLIEAKTIKKYNIPEEIKDALENKLDMYPLMRFVEGLKALNSIPPAYRVFLLNGNYFDVYYEKYSLMLKIEKEEYYLADLDERNYAKKHINRLMTEPIIKTGDDEDIEDIEDESPSPPPPPPPTPEPEEPEV